MSSPSNCFFLFLALTWDTSRREQQRNTIEMRFDMVASGAVDTYSGIIRPKLSRGICKGLEQEAAPTPRKKREKWGTLQNGDSSKIGATNSREF